MKDTLFVVVLGILIYLGFATIFGYTGLMGSYGSSFAKYNNLYFGYVSYVYVLALLLPLYYLYKRTIFSFRKVEISLATFLLFFALLLAQAMLIENNFRGKMAGDFVNFLSPYIGYFGLWIFWFIITFVSVIILLDKNSKEIVFILNSLIKSKLPEPKIKQESKKTVNVEKNIEKKTEKKENVIPKVKVVEVNNVQDVEMETISDEVVDELDTPSYIRAEISEDETKEEIEEEEIPIIIKKVEPKIEEEVEIIVDEPTVVEQEEIVEEEAAAEDILVETPKEQNNAVVVEELEENAKLLEGIEKGEVEKPKNFILPSVEFLQKNTDFSHSVEESELDDKIGHLISKLANFKIDGDVVRTYAGPVVSTFEFKPAANVKVSKILNLQDDLAMALSAETIRIQAPIPGKDVVGIEIPNETVDTIYLRELLDDKLFKEASSPLTIVLGKDIVGKPFITDLKKLPHLLIAGTTGSGKSVGINAMILSLLYKNSPDQLRLLMIDPKMLEFSTYNDIPHLLTPVITKPKQAIVALNNMVQRWNDVMSSWLKLVLKILKTTMKKLKKRVGNTSLT